MIAIASTLAAMAIHPALHPVIALVAGICILLKPVLLARIVAIYLIVVGLLGLAEHLL